MTTKEKSVIVRYRLKKTRARCMARKGKDMSTIILSLNKIVERQFDAMPVHCSEQGFDCVYSYLDKISRDTEEDID